VQNGAVSGQLPFEVTSNAWAPPAAGTWYFRATYSGNSNYTSSKSNPVNETLTVDPADTVTATLLNPVGPILVGETVEDIISINTTTGGIFPDASGNWQLEASQDVNFASGVVAVQNGAVSGQLPFEVTSNAWAPPAAGTWYFRATYSGDSNYTSSKSNPANEILTVVTARPVGGEVYPVNKTAILALAGDEIHPTNKLAVLAPWIALGVVIAVGAAIVIRHRRAQG
jgi:hypothetical protein